MTNVLKNAEQTPFTGEQVLDKTIELLGAMNPATEPTVSIPMDSNNSYRDLGDFTPFHEVERRLESSRNMTKGDVMRKAMVKVALLHEILHFSGPSRSLVLDTSNTQFRANVVERDIIGGFDVQVSAYTYTAESLLGDERDHDLIQNLGKLLLLGQDHRDTRRRKPMFEGFKNNSFSLRPSPVNKI